MYPRHPPLMQPNALLAPLGVCGLPVPLLVAVAPIAAGEEVLIEYGEGYWGAWRGLRRTTLAAAARGAGGR